MTQELLKEICDYDPVFGTLIWKQSGRKRRVGYKVGSLGNHGYLETSINYNRYLVHRLVWLWHTGHFPVEHTDHINHNKQDNRIENLRSVTNGQNNYNQSKRKKPTTSKYRGVSWCKAKRKWKASIQVAGIYKFIGYYTDEKSAAIAWNTYAANKYGQYANLNEVSNGY